MDSKLYEDEIDEFFDEAVKLVIKEQKASASLIQRKLKLGYARSVRLLDQLEKMGIISQAQGIKPREILMGLERYKIQNMKVKKKKIVKSKWKKVEISKVKKDILKKFLKKARGLDILLGQNGKNKPVVLDMEKYGNLMISGTQLTQATKLLNLILATSVAWKSDEDLKLIIIDGYGGEINFPDNSSHLLVPVIRDPDKAISALKWTITEINNRLKAKLEKNPNVGANMLMVISGLDNIMGFSPGETEESVYRILRLGRDCGVYTILGVDNIDYGKYKLILPLVTSKIMFGVTDSRLVDKENRKDVMELKASNEAVLWRMFEENLKFEVLKMDERDIYSMVFE